MLKRLLLAQLFFIALLVSVGQAATYYVATTGSDVADGAIGTPWRTVAKCAATMIAGDTCYVRGGTYLESVVWFRVTGTPAAPIKLLAYPGESPIIELSYYNGGTLILNSAVNSWLEIRNSLGSNRTIGWITIDGFEIRGGTSSIRLYNGNDITITRNWIHHNGHGILGNGVRVLIDRNRINHNGQFYKCENIDSNTCSKDHGLYLSGKAFNITHNLIYDNLAFGLQMDGSTAYNASVHAGIDYVKCRDWIIASNVFAYQNYGAAIMLWSTITNVRIENNVLYENSQLSISANPNGFNFFGSHAGTFGNTLQNNWCYASAPGGTPCIVGGTLGTHYTSTGNIINTVVPGFVDAPSTLPATPDFRLLAGSNLIDAGLINGAVYNGNAPDIGAYETFRFVSCEVPSTATSTIQVTFENNLYPPMLPASGATTFTARKNAASNTVSGSVTRIGDNIYSIPLTNAYVGGDTADISWASGNLTDSSLIGYANAQAYLGTLTNQSCTNNAGGAPTYTFTQAAFELHDWRGLEASPTMLPHGFASSGAAENFASYRVGAGGKIRVRLAIVCGGADCPPTGFYLYHSTGGGYTQIQDTFGAANIKLCGAIVGTDMPNNGAATTNQLSTSGTFTPGGTIFTANAIPTIIGLNNGYKTEVEYCLDFDTDATGNEDVRLYKQDGTALNTYTVTPRLVLEPMAAGGM